MKERILQIMENERMSPSAFADSLQIGRAVISHILNGRNNPSLDVVTRILNRMNYVNPDWLLTGKGGMYKSDSVQADRNSHLNSKPQDLFSQNAINENQTPVSIKNEQEIVPEKPLIVDTITEKQKIEYIKAPDKRVVRIIIYYSDNTFETFNTDNKPL